jgi:DNA-binding transcriptional MerR regulator
MRQTPSERLNESPDKLIGQLSHHTGLEPKTVRYYERAGLLHPRRIGRLRVYSNDDLERLKVIKLLRQFNLSIRKIHSLIEADGTMRIDQLSLATKEAISEQLSRCRTEYDVLLTLCSELKVTRVQQTA